MKHPKREPANLMVSKQEQGRVLAVKWEQHDPLNCDGYHLELDTTGFLNCPVSGCTWSFDPQGNCPEHGRAVS